MILYEIMELVLPSAHYKDSFIEAVREFRNDDDYTHRNKWYRSLSIPELEADFDAFVELELSHARGENIPEGYVPYTNYWLVEGGEYIGQATLRHQLNEHLLKIGGHIGYDIRPSKRRLGYGNTILELALVKAKERGIDRALVTSDVRNTASQKIIEKNGGVFEGQSFNPEMGHDVLRYWIDIA
jgi:predicted acetyltransferase